MATLSTPTRYTPADLLAMPDGDRFELANGQLIEDEMSLKSAGVAAEVIRILGNHLAAHPVGRVFSSDASYQCFGDDPDKVRRPDVSFVQLTRLSPLFMSGHVPVPPDLAVEVVSPTDRVYDVDEKIDEYLAAGVKVVWLINPENRTVRIYRPDGTIVKLGESAILDGGDLLPHLRVKVGDFFPPELPSPA